MEATVSCRLTNDNSIICVNDFAALDTACCRYPYNRNRFYKFDDQDVSETGANRLQVRFFVSGCLA